MGFMVFTNNGTSRLKSAVGAASLVIALASGDGARFPAIAAGSGDYFMVTGDDRRTGQLEIMKCTARTGDILTVVRAQEGTTAQNFLVGALVSHRMTAGTLQYFQDLAILAGGYPKPEADARFVNVDGDTMTAPLVLPAAAPTLATQASNKGYVDTQIATRAPTLHGHPQSDITNLIADLALKAPLASPGFTGTPTAPTAVAGTSTFQLATTSFVVQADNLKANLSGGNTFTGNQLVGGNVTISGAFALVLTAPAGTARSVALQTVGSNRWIYGTDAAVEGGSNSGANFSLARYSDVGVFIDTPFSITRANGVAAFSFPPTWPTPSQGDNANRGATTSYVDIGLAPKATIASPAFTGTPTAPTATPGTNTTQLATTAFVTTVDLLKADIASPSFTGVPSAPTATLGTSTSQLATTGFVAAGLALKADSVTLGNYQLTSQKNQANGYAGLDSTARVPTSQLDLTGVAFLASPVFTGTPSAPTANPGTSSTQLATTAFVTTADNLKANLAGGNSFTGNQGITGNATVSGAFAFIHTAAAGVVRKFTIQTAASNRWLIGADGVTEAGSNAGSNFGIDRYTDVGVFIDTPLSIARSSGICTFTTQPVFPTATAGDNTTKGATTGFVFAGLALKADTTVLANYQLTSAKGAANGYASLDPSARVPMAQLDLSLYATLASPALSGAPTAPTAAAGTNTTQLATTAFVFAGLALKVDTTTLANYQLLSLRGASNGYASLDSSAKVPAAQLDLTLYAPLASPALTGNPTAPTQTAGDSSTKLATTAFVTTADNLKAPLASPVFTGNPTAPTPAPGDNDTSVATTAFVVTAIASGGIDLTPYQTRSEKGVALGYASLDSSGFVPTAQLNIDLSTLMPKAGGTFTGLVTMSGGATGSFGGSFDISKPASGTTLAGTGVRFDISGNSLRIYENATAFRGVTLDLTTCGAQSTWWHSGNFNPANYSPFAGPSTGNNFTAGDITAIRVGNTTGVIFFGSSGGRYLYYDGSQYILATAALSVGGNITAFASDARLKKNVRPICKSALLAVKKLRGVRFEWDEDGPQPMRGTEVGVLAHEVQEVLPEAVTLAPFDRAPMTGQSISGKDYQTINGGQQLIALLINAVNELQERLDILEAEI